MFTAHAQSSGAVAVGCLPSAGGWTEHRVLEFWSFGLLEEDDIKTLWGAACCCCCSCSCCWNLYWGFINWGPKMILVYFLCNQLNCRYWNTNKYKFGYFHDSLVFGSWWFFVTTGIMTTNKYYSKQKCLYHLVDVEDVDIQVNQQIVKN